MPDQQKYYDRFGEDHRESILNCPEPEFWTTDYDQQGRVYQEMKIRIKQQQDLVLEFFDKAKPVLDIGCGFGRQAFWLSKNGFEVTGTDSSKVFIDIAKRLFLKNGLKGEFLFSLFDRFNPGRRFSQLLILDVFEHINPGNRKEFVERVLGLTDNKATLLLSIPKLRERLISKLNNSIRKNLTRHFSYWLNREEHPYPIPGKNSMLKYWGHNFDLVRFQDSKETLYFVFRRKK